MPISPPPRRMVDYYFCTGQQSLPRRRSFSPLACSSAVLVYSFNFFCDVPKRMDKITDVARNKHVAFQTSRFRCRMNSIRVCCTLYSHLDLFLRRLFQIWLGLEQWITSTSSNIRVERSTPCIMVHVCVRHLARSSVLFCFQHYFGGFSTPMLRISDSVGLRRTGWRCSQHLWVFWHCDKALASALCRPLVWACPK